MNLGPHAAFIWTSYAITVGALVAVLACLTWDGRRYRARLDEMERRGIRRRSAAKSDASTG